MKKIVIPATVQLLVLDEKNSVEELRNYPFTDFLINNALVHKAFGSSLEYLEVSQSLTEKLLQSQPGDAIEMEDKVWELLDTLVNRPEHPYGDVKLMRKLLPYMRAVRNAESQ